jgi:hypothetical protein
MEISADYQEQVDALYAAIPEDKWDNLIPLAAETMVIELPISKLVACSVLIFETGYKKDKKIMLQDLLETFGQDETRKLIAEAGIMLLSSDLETTPTNDIY